MKIINAEKLDTHACFGYFIGFDLTSIGYRIYFPDKKQIRVEHEVIFNCDDKADPVVWTAETLAEGERCKFTQHPLPTHNDDPDNAPHTDETKEFTPNNPTPLQDPDLEEITPKDRHECPC